MGLRTDRQNKLFDKGKDAWERTDDFKRRVAEVKQALRDKYQVQLSNERNWFKRQLIKLRYLIELKKKTSEISSAKNLHLISGGVWSR